MFATALIVFREVLEASLIVTIILAATRGVRYRGLWVMLGIVGGVAGAGLVAACTTSLASLFDGAGQDIVDAAILFLAVLLIGTHIIWMNSHGREIAMHMREVGNKVSKGSKHLSILAIVVGLAVMREGSEIVLMLQGLWAGQSDAGLLYVGAGLGVFAGISAGALMYLGFITLPLHKVFALTNGLLMLIAAGMAARGADFLVQADLIRSFGTRLWDSSAIISDQSIVGQILSALTGYIARPSGIEVIFYVTTLITVIVLMKITRMRTLRVPAVMAIILGGIIMIPQSSYADEVLSPYVTKGELEVEQQGYIAQDRNKDVSGEKNLIGEVGYSPTDFWRAELEGEFDRDQGQGNVLRYGSFNWENTFQVTEPGEYWVDSGLFAEVDFTRQDEANNFIFGYLGAKQLGRVMETANFLIHKDVGSDTTATGFIYSSQTKYLVKPWIEPGFEIYGDTQGKENFANQSLAAGPGVFGKIYTFDAQALKYEVAYLFGATPATPDNAVRWKLEYEFYF